MGLHEQLYNMSVEPLTDMNQRAHTGGGTETIEVKSGEGLVEDLYEAHLKNLYVAYREPAAVKIAKLASALEEAGFEALAGRVDEVLAGYFESGLVKQAVRIPGWAAGLGAAAIGLATPAGQAMGLAALYTGTGVSTTVDVVLGKIDGLKEDAQDLLDEITDWADDPDILKFASVSVGKCLEATKSLATAAADFEGKFKLLGAQPSHEALDGLSTIGTQIDGFVASIDKNLNYIIKSTGGSGWFNQNFAGTTSRFNDVKQDVLEAKADSSQAEQTSPNAHKTKPTPPQADPNSLLAQATQLDQRVDGIQPAAKIIYSRSPEKLQMLNTILNNPPVIQLFKNFKSVVLPQINAGVQHNSLQEQQIEKALQDVLKQVSAMEYSLRAM